MAELRVHALWQAPIKGCAMESLEYARINDYFAWDRYWVVVDEQGMFCAQRNDAKLGVCLRSMALIKPNTTRDDCMYVTAPNMPPLVVPYQARHSNLSDVQVWSWQGKGIAVSPACSDWFTEFLSRERPGKYRLMQMPDEVLRPNHTGGGLLGYADGFSLLIISQASLDSLSEKKGGGAVDVRRFRPNIVLSGCPPHTEDILDRIRVRNITFEGQKDCDRCDVPMLDPDTGEPSDNPLPTLVTYRRWQDAGGKWRVWFGRNFTHQGNGHIYVNDAVEVLEHH